MQARRPLLCFNVTDRLDASLAGLRDQGWEPMVAGADWREAVKAPRPRVAVVMVSGNNDLERLDEHLRGLWTRGVKVIALVPERLRDDARLREQILQGCYDFHTLPVDPARLSVTLGRAWGMATYVDRAVRLEQGTESVGFGLVGNSPAMRSMVKSMRRLVNLRAPLLISGESGTGKEQVSRGLHEASRWRGGPFVAVNCAALPPGLIQSELFGHERGAFTGADRGRLGRIEASRGGTLLLDEIGDLPQDVQINLLRFLEEGTIERLGSTETSTVETRIIAATHIDLERAVAQGRFREDLYYRLTALKLRVPPLREREGDVDLLAQHYFQRLREETRTRARGFSTGAMKAMRQHYWPGNVRELINRVRQGMALCERRLISRGDLELEQRARRRQPLTLADARSQAEAHVLLATRDRCAGNVSAMARELGVSRAYLYELMAKHHITPNRPGGKSLPRR